MHSILHSETNITSLVFRGGHGGTTTEFQLLKDGKKAGFIDVTNKGFTIMDDLQLSERFGNKGFEFVRGKPIGDGVKTNIFFEANVPARSMLEMLVRLQPNLLQIGCELVFQS